MCPTPNNPGANCTTGNCTNSPNSCTSASNSCPNGANTCGNGSSNTGEKPLLSLRSLVVFFLALVVGVLVGGLTFLATTSAPSAILALIPAFAGTVYFANKIIE